MNHTSERHLAEIVKIKIKNQKRGKVRRHECLLHFSWIYTHPNTSTYSPLFQPVWCDRINQLASWGGKCGETPLTAGLLCRIVDVLYSVYSILQTSVLLHLILKVAMHTTALLQDAILAQVSLFLRWSPSLLHFCDEFHDMNIGVQYFKEQGRVHCARSTFCWGGDGG